MFEDFAGFARRGGRVSGLALAMAASLALAGSGGPGGSARGEAATQPAPAGGASADLEQQVHTLAEQVKALQQRQRELEGQLRDQGKRDEEVAQAIEGVRRDASAHSRLLETGGAAAGWDPDQGFYLRSSDGRFLLHPWALLQARDVTNFRQAGAGAGDSLQNGLEIRRLQLGFDGTALTPDLSYRVFIQKERGTGDMELFLAYARYHFAGTPWSVLAGQFKAPLDHEQLVSDRYQLAADRTLTDDVLANGEAFSDGAAVSYDDGGPLRASADITDGYAVNNVNFEDYPTRSANFGVGGRAEYKLLGDWRDYDQFTSLKDRKDELLVVGGGIDLTEAGHTNYVRHVIDVQYNTGPLGLYAAYLGRYIARYAMVGDAYDASLRLQASLLLPGAHFEPFVRYDYLHLDGKEFKTPSQTNLNEFTAGLNYYLSGHAAKFTLDLSYLPEGSPLDDNGSGVLLNDGHAEIVGRAQFQLLL